MSIEQNLTPSGPLRATCFCRISTQTSVDIVNDSRTYSLVFK